MKTVLTVILLTLPCFAQKDIQVVLTNASVSVWNRPPKSGENIYKKRNPDIKNMLLNFTLKVFTKEPRAYPVELTICVLSEKKDGSRKWRRVPWNNVTGFKWKVNGYSVKELKSSEVIGTHRITAGIDDIEGKIIAYSIKAVSRYGTEKEPVFNESVFLEWKDKNAKGITKPPIVGSKLEDSAQ
jgi:hypothetical protein